MHQYQRSSHVDFTNPDFVKYAESFGAAGYRVTGPGKLQGILKESAGAADREYYRLSG